MLVLFIEQNEDTRFKVREGREIHRYKTLTNKDYLRKKIDVRQKEIDQELYSEKAGIHGKVDEILFLGDGSAAPLDYKYAEYKNKIYKTYRIQSIMYGMLIKDNFNLTVNKGYLVYTRSKNHLEELQFNDKDFDEVAGIINEIKEIVEINKFPKRTKVRSRCLDCCYRNICIQ